MGRKNKDDLASDNDSNLSDEEAKKQTGKYFSRPVYFYYLFFAYLIIL
jgi:hypothetical protein